MMKSYAQRSDGAYVSFTGMSREVINAMLSEQGLSCTFIDEAAYNAAISAQGNN